MADEGEIDVLGDFDFKLEAGGGMYDENELPSKSANLLPEYTNPPWMLEQGWPMDSSMDEKSKATIEKMLMEEQYYINGKASSRAKQRMTLQSALSHAGVRKRVPPNQANEKEDQKKWTENEKDMFKRGLEIFGRSWTKIAELIPTKTILQIKNYSYQYFKQNKPATVTESSPQEAVVSPPASTEVKDPLGEVLATVSTANPTVQTIKPIVPRKGRIPKCEKKGVILMKQQSSVFKRKAAMTKLSPPKPKKNVNVKSGSEKLKSIVQPKFVNGDVSITCVDKMSVSPRNRSLLTGNLDVSLLNQKLTITQGLMENLDGFCAVADILAGGQEEVVGTTGVTSNEDENEDDIDIDIENDDEDGLNPFLQGRSVSPNSVYEKLVAEANMVNSADGELNTVQTEVKSESERTRYELPQCSKFIAEVEKISPSVGPTNAELLQSELGEEEQIATTCSSNVKNECAISTDLTESETNVDDQNDDDSEKEEDVSWKGSSPRVEAEYRLGDSFDWVPEKLEQEKVFMNVVCNCEGEIIHFPIPKEELIFEPDMITEEEKIVHKDFFETKRPSSKNPDRYLKIRNYILESWKKSKPTYLNKTSVRPGLKNCGDVNCIGRVHAYLECVGAINFGSEQATYKHARPAMLPFNKERTNKEYSGEVNAAKLEAMRPRKRKVKDAFGVWIDEKELEGKTIEHELKSENCSKEVKQRSFKSGYDPFKLIPCLPFDQEHPAPFLMEVHKSALIVMDIHSHMCKTEVIGMLGGHFSVEDRKLTVTIATPCNSVSTGMQCEMDPVSQTQAQEEIQSCGMEVVGWYHSHPSFAPNPSVRDIETQLKFQEWFSKGGSNFVGIIVSPYNPRCPRLSSEITCLTISDEVLPLLQCNIPFKFDYSTRECSREEINTIQLTAQDLSTSYASYPNKVDLLSPFSCHVTCLQKMLESVKVHLPDCDNSGLLNNLKKIFLSCDYEPVSQSEDTHSNQSSDSNQDVVSNQSSTLQAMGSSTPALTMYPVVTETIPEDLINTYLSPEIT